MARKAILQDHEGIEILPITRAELILDSYGNQAFRSASLLDTDSDHGLISAQDKKLLKQAIVVQEIEDGIATLANNNNPIFPKTTAKAVIINNTNLENYLEQKLNLDERPTKGSTNGVQSGGVYDEIEEVVGVIYTNLKTV